MPQEYKSFVPVSTVFMPQAIDLRRKSEWYTVDAYHFGFSGSAGTEPGVLNFALPDQRGICV
ncbi:uncharacterized protein N7529_009385 [Penicillium soppii]|jgi:hypothetical protein|uniref:uncharacterized protein n=1 Tax=Penicillium soppii TaxID=69789 RepID=UPI0025465C49|nr:uncharacterized protein N7529_009385 [Penicillium soppii]KAJ5855441.1 hypothetical protein N7529_009385 [Penicillium soppii]